MRLLQFLVKWYNGIDFFLSPCAFSLFSTLLHVFIICFFFWAASLVDPSFLPFFPGANQYTTVKERGQNRTRTEQSRRGGAKKNEAKHHVHLSCFFLFFFFWG